MDIDACGHAVPEVSQGQIRGGLCDADRDGKEAHEGAPLGQREDGRV